MEAADNPKKCEFKASLGYTKRFCIDTKPMGGEKHLWSQYLKLKCEDQNPHGSRAPWHPACNPRAGEAEANYLTGLTQ